MTQPWERQPKESNKSWLWFRIYRDLLHNRTHQQVIDYIQQYNTNIEKHQQNGSEQEVTRNFQYGFEKLPEPSIKNLQNLSSIHKWRKRTDAYDNYIDQQEIKAREQAYIDEEKEYLKLMHDTREALQQNIQQITKDNQSRATSKSHALKSASQSLDTLYKDLRLAHGKSTENKDTNINADLNQEVRLDADVDFKHQLIDKKFHEQELDYLKQLINKD